MITFHKLRLKNFLSYGNTFTEIELSKHSKTLFQGGNGCGKSATHTAFTFCLFGKTQRKVNIPQLVNSINGKDCLVELEFNIGSDNFLLRRGIKPQIFEIYKNDVLINPVSQTKDYQKFFEENILKTNFRTFSNVVTIGGRNYASFMSQSKADRRKMIESLLDIDIFSSMNQIAKTKSLDLQEQLKNKKYDIQCITNEISFLKSSLEKTINFSKNSQHENDKKILEFQDKLSNINIKIDELDLSLNKIYETQGTDLENLQKTIKQKKDKIEINRQLCKNKISSITKEQQFFEKNETCPSCHQDISLKIKDEFLIEKNVELNKIIDYQNSLDKKNIECSSILNEINSTINTINNLLSEKNNLLQLKKNYLSIISDFQNKDNSSKISDNEIILLEKEISEKLEQLLELKNQAEKLREENDYVDFCQILLKDDGIKTLIIKEYLPKINSCLNNFLERLDLFIDFQFDEHFNEIIRARHRDSFSYESFSDGQKMKIDLCLLFTWREIAKLKNSLNTNILFCDELLDQSLDPVSTELAIKLLDTLPTEICCFIISHKVDLFDKMDRVLKVELVNNFSTITDN